MVRGVEGPRTVAALFVERGGPYWDLPGVDPWDVARDARLYRGPHPVVAHPPCNRWAMPLAKVNETRYGHRVGDDGGMFKSALRCVVSYGGVLEHPAHTAAWRAHGLQKPVRGSWQWSSHGLWQYGSGGVWVTEVSQVAYGHPARKRTWLAFRGPRPPDLDWSEPPARAVTSWLQKTKTELPRITKREACKTPEAFARMLVSLARTEPMILIDQPKEVR